MADNTTHVSNVAERYGSALFELALAEKKLPEVERDLIKFDDLINGNDELMRVVRSPVFSRDEQFNAIDKILDKAGFEGLVANFIRVIAKNRRLFIATDMLKSFKALLAVHNGEVTAEVSVAQKLTSAQEKELKAALQSAVGKDVTLDVTLDPSILGGMIVKIGSRQIDTSLRTKLSSLKLSLKEVG